MITIASTVLCVYPNPIIFFCATQLHIYSKAIMPLNHPAALGDAPSWPWTHTGLFCLSQTKCWWLKSSLYQMWINPLLKIVQIKCNIPSSFSCIWHQLRCPAVTGCCGGLFDIDTHNRRLPCVNLYVCEERDYTVIPVSKLSTPL